MNTLLTPLLLIVSTLFFVANANASVDILAKCGKSKGYNYYSGSDPKGWVDDGISKGSTTITLEGKDFDVLYSNGKVQKSSRHDDNAAIVTLAFTEDVLTLLVNYGPRTDMFFLDIKSKILMHTSSRYDGSVSQGSKILASQCEVF
jgi:hypothetical protein